MTEQEPGYSDKKGTDKQMLDLFFGKLVKGVEEIKLTPPEDLQAILREQVDRVLAGLTPRDRLVLDLRFGFTDGYARTLRETGQDPRINRSPSTVWRIEHGALAKLRSPGRRRTLRDYLA